MANAVPADVVDGLLWRDAQEILACHAGPDGTRHCRWCGQGWPCPARRCAERAAAAARRPWNEAWTARHDLNSMRTLTGWRPDPGGASRGGWHRAGSNRKA